MTPDFPSFCNHAVIPHHSTTGGRHRSQPTAGDPPRGATADVAVASTVAPLGSPATWNEGGKVNWMLALALFALQAYVYGVTLFPSVPGGDSGELIAVSHGGYSSPHRNPRHIFFARTKQPATSINSSCIPPPPLPHTPISLDCQ